MRLGNYSWIVRTFFLGYLSLVPAGVAAQSYQTAFSGEAFDRAKGAATIHAGVEIDGATGAASFNIPFGPGIGTRGIAFRPVLSGHVAPGAFGRGTYVGVNGSGFWTHSVRVAPGSPFTFAPGSLDLGVSDDTLDEFNPKIVQAIEFVSQIRYPDGNSTSFGISGWQANQATCRISGPLPSEADLTAILAAFGFAAGSTPVNVPWMDGVPQAASPVFVTRDGAGALVIGFGGTSPFPNTENGSSSLGYIPTGNWHVPNTVLVVTGGVAYEFASPIPWFEATTGEITPHGTIQMATNYILRKLHYRLKRILNRYGEAIEFDYSTSVGGYTATWRQGVQSGGAGASTAMAITVAPTLVATDATGSRVDLAVTYSGMDKAPSFTLAAMFYGPWQTGASDPLVSLRPLSFTAITTGEVVSFGYGDLPPASSLAFPSAGYGSTALTSIQFPNRTISLHWTPYQYIKNDTTPGQWMGYWGTWDPNFPNWFWGVVQVDDTDAASGITYTTSHHRVVPKADYAAPLTASSNSIPWLTTGFYDAVVHPDGTVTMTRFTEPLQGSAGFPGSPLAQQMQMLAHLKHMPTEVRRYTPQAATDWDGDLAKAPNQSSAFAVELNDRWDVRGLGNPSGDFTYCAVPYPTRMRAFDLETKVLRIEEKTSWDGTGLGWQASYVESGIEATPALSRPEGTPNVLSLMLQVQTPAYPAMTNSGCRKTTATFSSNLSTWFLGRTATQQVVVLQDGTGSWVPTTTYPALPSTNLPATTWTYDPPSTGLSRPLAVTISAGGSSIVTTHGFSGNAGALASGELHSVTVSGTGEVVPMSVGIASYQYDSLGFLSSIRPLGVSWTLQQSQDGLGRPQTQTDANGLVTRYQWDAGGRLEAIQPTSPEVSTDIAYHSDHLGATVTRGAQRTEYRYNGLGQLLLIRRWDAGLNTSHKVYTYDLAGRRVFESGWRQGSGTDTEGLAGGSDGEVFTFDGRGRELSRQDANGIRISMNYAGLSRTRTLNGQATTSTLDAMGRLVTVQDALSQVTEYRYDTADHMVQAVQKDTRTIPGSTMTQSRSWGFHPLGWLNRLDQPESGTTKYEAFTVSGKPTRTLYVGDGTHPEREVVYTYDQLMRTTAVQSKAPDTSVAQAFGYDGALPAGASLPGGGFGLSNNQMNYARDGAVEQGFSFGGLNGRLSQLLTRVWVASSAGSTSHDFSQTFTQDTYGHRIGGTTPGGTSLAVGWELAKGHPTSLAYGALAVASATFDNVTWNLEKLSGSGWFSQFFYDNDQARLHRLYLVNPSQTANWTFTYDGSNNLIAANEQFNGRLAGDATTGNLQAQDTFTYDGLNRLLTANVQNLDHSTSASQSLTYDGFGNTISLLNSPGTLPDPNLVPWSNLNSFFGMTEVEIRAQAANNRLPATMAGRSTGQEYDGQGNLTRVWSVTGQSVSEKAMTYDALGRVTQMTDARRGVAEVYAYSPGGLRTLVETWQGTTLLGRAFNLYNDARQLVSQYRENLPGTTAPPVALRTSLKAIGARTSLVVKEPCEAQITTPATSQLTVQVGQSVLFAGWSDLGTSAQWAFGDGLRGSGFSTSHTYAATGTFTVTLSVWGPAATTTPGSITMTVTVVPAVSIVSFAASASTIPVGGGSTLTWSTSGATSVTLNESPVAASGSLTVFPGANSTYVLAAANGGMSVTQSIALSVVQAPLISAFGPVAGTVLAGNPATLAWVVSGATSIAITPQFGTVTGITSVTWTASVPGTSPVTTAYTLTATNTVNGVSVSRTALAAVTVMPDPTAPIIVFYASPSTIGAGQSTTLIWSTSASVGTVTVSLNGVAVASSGSSVISPGITTSYQLVATSTQLGAQVQSSASTLVTVVPRPTLGFTACVTGGSTPGTTININQGQSATLVWSASDNPSSVTLGPGLGSDLPASGSTVVSPTVSTTYTLTATNLAGSSSAQVVVNVTPLPVISTFSASPGTIALGRGSTLTWSVTGATSYTINTTSVTNASVVVAPPSTQTYTLYATNAAGTTSAQVTVTVIPAGTLEWLRDILYLGGKEVGEVDAQGLHVVQADRLGSPFYVLDKDGTIVGRQKHLAFGETLDRRGSLTSAKGFTNHEQTDPSGLIYMQARFYLPMYHRFASPDPARDQHFEETQSWNIYSYVQNNPGMSIDPTGMLNFGCDGTFYPAKHERGSDASFVEGSRTASTTDWYAPTRSGTQADGTGATTNSTSAQTNADKPPPPPPPLSGVAVVAGSGGVVPNDVNRVKRSINLLNTSPLTDEQRTALTHIKGINVVAGDGRSGMDLSSGIFTINVTDIREQSRAWTASIIAHDSFHQYRKDIGQYRGTGVPEERLATQFQLDVGRKIGLETRYVQHLESYKNNMDAILRRIAEPAY